MPRTPAAVLAATTCVVDGGWGNYRQFQAIFSFYAANRRCRTFLARDRDDRVVATSVAIRFGRNGWIAHVFVRPDLRGRGLGAWMTSVAIDDLQRRGCDSIVLAATELGRPVYERLGFKVESAYHELRGTALPKTVEMSPFRPLLPSDRGPLLELDRRVTGDERGPVISTFVPYGWGLDGEGRLAGAVIPVPWGGAAAILLPGAGDGETAALIRLMRTVGAVGSEVTVHPVDENARALHQLREEGFEEIRTVPRMVLGRRLAWMPAAIWSPLSLGLG